MKKLISLAAALLLVVSFTIASADPSEARGRGRWVAGLALGLAGAAILHHQYRRHHDYYDPYYYSYYPSYGYYYYYPSYGYYYDYYPRRHWKHRRAHRHHGRHHRRHSFY